MKDKRLWLVQEAFEQWATGKQLDTAKKANPNYPEITYQDIQVQLAWECWQIAWEKAVAQCW